MAHVGIVIVNYKDYAQKFLRDCRDSLRIQTYPAENFQVYVVDNAASEESLSYLKQQFPEAKILAREDGNYSAAQRLGFETALHDGADFLVTVNMDVVLDKDWLAELVNAAETHPELGIIQSKVLLFSKDDGVEKINSLGNKFHYLGFGFTDGYQQLATEIIDNDVKKIDGYASGCSFITRKELIEKIGFHDEEYYMYHDDFEFSWRARLAGFEIGIAPRSILWHKYEFGRSVKMVYYMERNRFLAVLTHYRIGTLILIAPAQIVLECGMLLYALKGGWIVAKIDVYKYFLNAKNWRKILDKRKVIERLREKSDREITDGFEGRVLFQEIENPILKYLGNPFMDTYWKLVKKIIHW